MSTEMNRMTTPNSQLTTSKTALVSPSHEQFIPERMNTKSTILKRFSLLLTAVLIIVFILFVSLLSCNFFLENIGYFSGLSDLIIFYKIPFLLQGL